MTARVEAAAKAMVGLSVKWQTTDAGELATAALTAADAVMFDEDAVDRVAEAMWLHRPMERVYDDGPSMGAAKPWAELKPYQHVRYRGWATAALAALKGDDQ